MSPPTSPPVVYLTGIGDWTGVFGRGSPLASFRLIRTNHARYCHRCRGTIALLLHRSSPSRRSPYTRTLALSDRGSTDIPESDILPLYTHPLPEGLGEDGRFRGPGRPSGTETPRRHPSQSGFSVDFTSVRGLVQVGTVTGWVHRPKDWGRGEGRGEGPD